MNQKKITKILDLFFAFNYIENSDSLMVFESNYEDNFFRWTKETFKHDYKLTALFNGKRILLFGTQKVRDRLLANQENSQSNTAKTHFGCKMEVVKDLVMTIPFETMTDDQIFDIECEIEQLKADNVIRAKELAKKEIQMAKVQEDKDRREKGRPQFRK